MRPSTLERADVIGGSPTAVRSGWIHEPIFFHIRQGDKTIFDDEGVECESLDAVRDEAVQSAVKSKKRVKKMLLWLKTRKTNSTVDR
jgi:hypothetical protein